MWTTRALVLAYTCNLLLLASVNGMNINTNPIRSLNVTIRKSIESDRTYYIGAVPIDWNFAENATNPFTGVKVEEDLAGQQYTLDNHYNRIGPIYRKCLYREFTDDTFTTMVERDEHWQHLGVMGPPIRAVVGDRIKVIFWNNCSFNFSVHPHGLQYERPSEGALYEGEMRGPNWGKDVTQGGQHVLPGDEWVYIWDVGEQFNELDVNEFGSKFWFYHSHIIEPIDTNTGLVGPIIITKSGFETSDDDPTPIDVDREFITLFTVFDENISWMIPFNLKHHLNSSNPYYKKYNDTYVNYIMEYDSDDDDFHESNLMHSMNGFTWNTMSKHLGVNNKIKLGERIRWYIGTIGTEEVDLHTAHWHGNLIINSNDYSVSDVHMMLPGYATQVDMITTRAGTWFYHCHVDDHVEAGMFASYTVSNETCDDCYGATHSMFSSQSSVVDGTSSSNGIDWDKDLGGIILVVIIVYLVLYGLKVFIEMCYKKYQDQQPKVEMLEE